MRKSSCVAPIASGCLNLERDCGRSLVQWDVYFKQRTSLASGELRSVAYGIPVGSRSISWYLIMPLLCMKFALDWDISLEASD